MSKAFTQTLLVSIAFLCASNVFSAAGVPKILNYQGKLLDSSGVLLGDAGTEFCFKFSFYDDTVVGVPDNKLWPSGVPSTMTVLVRNGVFDALIGDTGAGGDALDFDFQLSDEIYVNTEAAAKVGPTCAPSDGSEVFENLAPRSRVASSGYSINSDTLSGFHAFQSASTTQIPILTGGNLFLGALAPEINATSSNALTLQGGSLSGNLILNPHNGLVGIGTTTPKEKLHIVNGSLLQDNPANPAVIGGGALSLPGGGAQGVFIVGQYAYMIFNNSASVDILRIIDVTDPYNPVIVGGATLSLPGLPRSIYVSGRYAYVIFRNSIGTDGLRIIDISNPSNPVVVGGPTLTLPLNGQDIYVSGRYAYVTFDNPAGKDTFRIIDIANPLRPIIQGGANLSLPTSPRQVRVVGNYAYVVFYNTVSTDALRIIDVSSPSNPMVVGGSALPLGFSSWSIDVSGRYAYIGFDNTAGTNIFRIVDIANPSNPVAVGGSSLSLPGFAKSVFTSGRYVYLALDNPAGTDTLRIIDVKNPVSPKLVGGAALSLPGFPKSIFIAGRHGYLGFFQGSGSDVFRVVDISGIEAVSAVFHSLQAGDLQLLGDIVSMGQIQTAGGLNVGNGGIYTSGPIAAGGGSVDGPLFQISGFPISTLFSVSQATTSVLDFSRVTVGGPTKRDQLYVYGRINSSWQLYSKDLMTTCAPLVAIVADTADICGLVFDEDTDGAVWAKVVGSSAIRIRASTAGSLAVGEGASLGSGGVLSINRDNNPVIETRVRPGSLDNHRMEIGFNSRALNDDMATDPVDGVYFRATPASLNWIAVNRSANSETGSAIDTGVPISIANFQELRIEVNGALDTRFFIDSNPVAVITANIPSVDLGFSIGNALITTANAIKNLNIESIKVWVDDPPEDNIEAVPQESEEVIEGSETGASFPEDLIEAIKGIVSSLFEDFVLEKIPLRDQKTGEIYCTWLEDGEWNKVKGVCGEDSSESNEAMERSDSDEVTEPEGELLEESLEPAELTEEPPETAEPVEPVETETEALPESQSEQNETSSAENSN